MYEHEIYVFDVYSGEDKVLFLRVKKSVQDHQLSGAAWPFTGILNKS